MEIKRSGSQPSGKGPVEYFTGSVLVDPLFNAPDPARIFGALVTFEPGARTARCNAGAAPSRKFGRVTWFGSPPVKSIGTAPTTARTHIAIVEQIDGKSTDWMEKVSDEQYRR